MVRSIWAAASGVRSASVQAPSFAPVHYPWYVSGDVSWWKRRGTYGPARAGVLLGTIVAGIDVTSKIEDLCLAVELQIAGQSTLWQRLRVEG